MSGFRENETESIAKDGNLGTSRDQWFFICYVEGKVVKHEKVKLDDKKRIVDLCKNKGGELFMVWHGEWRTDVFPLNYKKAIARVNVLGNKK